MKILTNKKYEEMKNELENFRWDKRWLESEKERLQKEKEELQKENEKFKVLNRIKLENLLKKQKWAILCDENSKVKVYNDGRLEETVRAVSCGARWDEVPTITIEK